MLTALVDLRCRSRCAPLRRSRALAVSSLGDPRPHPRRLARGLAAARGAAPHLHRRRVVPDAPERRRAGDRAAVVVVLGLGDSPGLDARRRARRDRPVRRGVGDRRRDAQPACRRPRRGSARPTSGPRPNARRAARVLAEERLRIAQELHDVVAHSMSVIAVQAGVGAHVLDDRPEQARAALEAISATSRGTLTEMRRLLGVLRDSDGVRVARAGARARRPAAARRRRARRRRAGDAARRGRRPTRVPRRRRAVGLPRRAGGAHQRDQARRHADARRRDRAPPARRRCAVEVVDDGRGLAARPRNGDAAEGSGHGLSACASGSSCGAASSSVGPRPAAGTASGASCPYGDAA